MKHFITLKDIPAADLRKIITDAKKRKIETGLRTPEDQAAGPIHIPSELLGLLHVRLKRFLNTCISKF